MFSPSPGEMLIILVIALLLFGQRLPEVARSVGKSIMEFQKGLRGIEREINASIYSTESDSKSSAGAKKGPVDSLEHEEATAPKFEPPA